VLAGTLI